MGSNQAGNLPGLLGAGILATEGRPCRSGTLKKQSRPHTHTTLNGQKVPSATHNCFSFPLRNPWVLVFVKCLDCVCVWGGESFAETKPHPPCPRSGNRVEKSSLLTEQDG